jgi:hypothetical protein
MFDKEVFERQIYIQVICISRKLANKKTPQRQGSLKKWYYAMLLSIVLFIAQFLESRSS